MGRLAYEYWDAGEEDQVNGAWRSCRYGWLLRKSDGEFLPMAQECEIKDVRYIDAGTYEIGPMVLKQW